MLFFPLLGIFLPYIIFFFIILLLEIDFLFSIKSQIRNIGRMMFKHLPGILILLIYYLYNFAWSDYHVGHYPITMAKEFRLFPSLDRHSNFIATLAIFYFLYSGLFLWLNGKLKNMQK